MMGMMGGTLSPIESRENSDRTPSTNYCGRKENQMSSLAIINLNEHCLLKIFSFLKIIEKIKLAQAWPAFWSVCQISIKSETSLIHISELYREFPDNEIKNIIINIGPYVSQLSISSPDIEDLCKIEQIISNHFRNLHELEIVCYQDIDLPSWQCLLSSLQGLKSFSTYGCDLNDDLCAVLPILNSLKRFSLQNCSTFSGKYICKLTNLLQLDLLESCGLEPKYFIEICHAVKLKTLNIRKCCNLNRLAFNEMVSTQDNLETLIMCNCYDTDSLDTIAHLKSLKNLQVFKFSSNICLSLFKALAKNKKDELKSLELYGFKISAEKMIQECIFKLINLRKFIIVYDRNVNDGFLRNLAANCLHLTEFSCPAAYDITKDGLLDFIKKENNLTILNISLCKQLNESFVIELIKLLKEKNLQKPFIVQAQHCGFPSDDQLYMSNKHFLKIILDSGYPFYYRSHESITDNSEEDYVYSSAESLL